MIRVRPPWPHKRWPSERDVRDHVEDELIEEHGWKPEYALRCETARDLFKEIVNTRFNRAWAGAESLMESALEDFLGR